jgi:hypothetical protein
VNLDSFRTQDVITGRGDDVFGIEFQNGWEARVARQAAELSAGGRDRPFVARRVLARTLATVSRGSAASVRRLDDVVADDLRRALVARE